MPLIRDKDNKPTEYSYDIVTAHESVNTKCGKVVIISKKSTQCALQYDLANKQIVAGWETATYDERHEANSYVDTYLRDWQAEIGLRHFVKFTAESDCYYDLNSGILYNASGKKGGVKITEPVQFAPAEQAILERLVDMRGFCCSYDDLSYAATGSEEGMAKETISVHISSIKKYDNIALRPLIVSSSFEGCKGYTYTGNKAEWLIGEPEKRTPKQPVLSLYNLGMKLLAAGKIERLVCIADDQSFMVQNVSEASVGAICKFFFPHTFTWSTEQVSTSPDASDSSSLIFYINRVCKDANKEWALCRQHLQVQLEQIAKLRLYSLINLSDPIPKSEDDLQRISTEVDPFVDGTMEQMQDSVSSLVNEDPYINSNFFMGRDVPLTKANLLDAVVALSWISFYQELIQRFPLLFQELEKYRKALVSSIKEIFFPPTSSEYESIKSFILAELREVLDIAMSDLDDRSERIEDIEKLIIERLNYNEILKNSGIRLTNSPNSNENESPIKTR